MAEKCVCGIKPCYLFLAGGSGFHERENRIVLFGLGLEENKNKHNRALRSCVLANK